MQWSYPFWLFNKSNPVSSRCWKLSLNEIVTLSDAWTYPADNYIYCADKNGGGGAKLLIIVILAICNSNRWDLFGSINDLPMMSLYTGEKLMFFIGKW